MLYIDIASVLYHKWSADTDFNILKLDKNLYPSAFDSMCTVLFIAYYASTTPFPPKTPTTNATWMWWFLGFSILHRCTPCCVFSFFLWSIMYVHVFLFPFQLWGGCVLNSLPCPVGWSHGHTLRLVNLQFKISFELCYPWWLLYVFFINNSS